MGGSESLCSFLGDKDIAIVTLPQDLFLTNVEHPGLQPHSLGAKASRLL